MTSRTMKRRNELDYDIELRDLTEEYERFRRPRGMVVEYKFEEFGGERVGVGRSIKLALQHLFKPSSRVNEESFWVLFRKNGKKALQLVRAISDTIELDFDRNDGVTFLNAYDTICRTCTPEYIERVIRMMFRNPVYFRRALSTETLKWLSGTNIGSNFTVSVAPVRVEYISEQSDTLDMLTKEGPYVTARLTRTYDDFSATTGEFSFYTAAANFFDETEGGWALEGVFRYTVVVTIKYSPGSTLNIGSSSDSIGEIIRRCVKDIIVGQALWTGYFGEDMPHCPDSLAYLKGVCGFNYDWFIEDFADMTEDSTIELRQKVTDYSIQAIATIGEDGIPVWTSTDTSNVRISGDYLSELNAESDTNYDVTIFPPKTKLNTKLYGRETEEARSKKLEEANEELRKNARRKGKRHENKTKPET